MDYPIEIVRGEGGTVMVRVIDVPEAVVVAKSVEEGRAAATEHLRLILHGYLVEGRAIPVPSSSDGHPTVKIGSSNLLDRDSLVERLYQLRSDAV